jgi:Integral membrane protein (PIN domain superfamily)
MVTIVKVILTVLGGVAGYEALNLGLTRLSFSGMSKFGLVALLVLGTLVGAAIGLVLGGVIGRQIVHLGQWLDRTTARVSAAALLITSGGLAIGLGLAALVSLGVKEIPVVGVFLLPLIFALSGYLFAFIAFKRQADIARLIGLKSAGPGGTGRATVSKLLDTSAIIDARIGDIVPTGFIDGELVVPNFVLEELQSIADSGDPLRRARGRRGLDCVAALQEGYDRVVISDRDYHGLSEVDAKLIKLAKEMGALIITTDYNLNKLAQIQGVDVLNVNELANALKPVVLPGESLEVRVIREGKEEDQGVAYLDDGTMVVVEGGRRKLGQDVSVEVTSVLQNPSGKMVFTKLAS